MEYTSESLVNPDTKIILKKKPHRKVASGLKLLTQIFKTVKTNKSAPFSEVNGGGNDEVDFLRQLHELPHDLFTHEILARLPIKYLLLLKSVSKEWYSTVSSYEFANVHFRTRISRYHPSSPVECLFIQVANKCYLFYLQEEEVVLDYCLVKLEPNFDNQDKLHLVGSCNGLVCLADFSSSIGYFYIWNPITYHWRKFPDPCSLASHCTVCWGFAYVSSLDDYKVVKIVQDYDTLEITLLVFSFQTQEWKHIYDHGLDPRISLNKTNPGVLVNDTLYWTMCARGRVVPHVVVGFDMALEKFQEIPELVINPRDHFLCIMGGCLSMCSSNTCKEAHLSILKRPAAGEVESMRLNSYSDKWSCSALVGFTRTGKAYVVSKAWELALIDVYASDKQYSPLVTLEDAHKPCIVSYVPSLISPSFITNLERD